MRSFAQSRVVGGSRTKCDSNPHVPGISQYSDTQDVYMDAGSADPCSLSFSTSAASQKKFPQEFDISSEAYEIEESIDNFG